MPTRPEALRRCRFGSSLTSESVAPVSSTCPWAALDVREGPTRSRAIALWLILDIASLARLGGWEGMRIDLAKALSASVSLP